MADPLSIAAIGWGLTATGWFISPYINRLLDKAYAHIKPGKSREKIRFLVNHTVPRLKVILEAAEGSDHKPLFEELLTDLRSAFYATEDILDEIEYVRRHQSARKHKLDSCVDDGTSNQSFGTLSSLTIPGPLSILLKENVTKIEELIKQAHTTINLANLQSNKGSDKNISSTSENNMNPTISDPVGKVTGREKVLEELTEMLHRPTSSGSPQFTVIGIIGIPGSGKTTLAQCVCGSEKSVGYFDLVIWIHVSEKFTVRTIYNEMFEQAWKMSTENEVRPQYSSLVMLKAELEKALNGKRFLLVLDDIWFNQEEAAGEQKLQQLLIPFKDGKEGSKILVTSRQDSLSRLGPDVTTIKFRIPDLDDEVFLKLFMYYALNSKSVHKEDKRKLQHIGAQIAQKLKKSPLLAKVVGGILFQKPTIDVRDWISVRDQNLLDKYMGALWWSYLHLGEQVRRCFAYCSIFPRRHQLYFDEIVNLWVSEGFITTATGGKEMEDVARSYFNELVSTSFLIPGGKDWRGQNYFLIHDLLHDLAVKVAGRDCFKIENGWTGKFSSDVRHISIQSCNASMIVGHILNLKNLRTLIIFDGDQDISEQVLNMFRRLSKLRVLIFGSNTYTRDSAFLVSIGLLKHLRYLGIRIKKDPHEYFRVTVSKQHVSFPGTLGKLYLLQVFEWLSVDNLHVSFGEAMIKLVDLRHVLIGHLCFPNIGRMRSLQTIPVMELLRGKGYELQQLKHLNNLQGCLAINDLYCVKSKEEALEAKLADKEGLTKLELSFSSGSSEVECSPELQADVLEGLRPPKYLKHLSIQNYNNSRYPSWLVGTQKSTMHLHRLKLYFCCLPVRAPEHYFISVSCLVLHCCFWDSACELETLPFNMDDLTWLKLKYCDFLPCNLKYLTSLKSLIIIWINSWVKLILPTLPRSLDYIEIRGWERLGNKLDDNNWKKIKHIPHIVFDGEEFKGHRGGAESDDDDDDSEATGSYESADSRTYSDASSCDFMTEEDSEGSSRGAATL